MHKHLIKEEKSTNQLTRETIRKTKTDFLSFIIDRMMRIPFSPTFILFFLLGIKSESNFLHFSKNGINLVDKEGCNHTCMDDPEMLERTSNTFIEFTEVSND